MKPSPDSSHSPKPSRSARPLRESLARANWGGARPTLPKAKGERWKRPQIPRAPRIRLFGLDSPLANLQARRFVFVALLFALLSSAFFSVHVLHFAQRNDTDRLVWGALPFWRQLEGLEFRLYDQRFTGRGVQVPRSRDKIAIVALDELSMSRFKQWPIPRSFYARLIERLNRAGARVIAIDIGFPDYHAPKYDAMQNVLLSAEDKALVAATAAAKNVIYPTYFSFDVKRDASGNNLGSINDTITPFDELDSETPDLATAFLPLDADNGARRYPWLAMMNANGDSPEPMGSFAGLAVAAFEKKLDGNENRIYTQSLKSGIAITADSHHQPVPLLRGKPANEAAPRISTMLINYWGPQTFQTYSFSDVLLGRDNAYSEANLKKLFDGRIVFVGPTAQILKDTFPMPQFTSVSQEGVKITQSQIAGVEIHATAAAMLLDGDFLRPPTTLTTILCVFGLTFFAALLAAGLRDWITRMARAASAWWKARGGRALHDLVWLALYVAVAVLPVLCFWSVAKWMFIHQSLWLVAVYPALSAAVTSGSVFLYSFGLEAGERRKALAQFARMVSPDVMDEILSHPEEEYPQPRRMHVTVLFTDLEGFTSYSETHEPEDVVEAMNSYLDRMVPIVQEYGGTIDKYIGDAIMAYFGAPVPRWDHAAQALHCAVALQNECAKFREETGIEFYMRVGVHTGDVIVGLSLIHI